MLSSLPFARSKPKPAASGRGKKGAGLALLTAAAGFAISNRDKISGLLDRNRSHDAPITPASPATEVNSGTQPTP